MYLDLARALDTRGRHAEAADALDRAVSERDDATAGDILLDLARELGHAKKSEAAFAVALDALRHMPYRSADIVPLLEEHLEPPALPGAADQLRAPGWVEVVGDPALTGDARTGIALLLSRALLGLDEPGLALDLLVAARKPGGDEARLGEQIGEARRRLNDTEGAVAALREAEAAARRDDRAGLASEINLRLALLYERQGQFDEALAQIANEPVPGSGSSAELLALRARCLLGLGDTAAAAETVAAAADLFPASLAVLHARAAVLIATHDYGKAVQVTDEGLDLSPADDQLSFSRIQALVEMQDDTLSAQGLLARLVRRVGVGEATEMARAAATQRSDGDGNLHYFLALLHHLADRPEDALREVDWALALGLSAEFEDPAMPAHHLRGLLLEGSRPEEAAGEYAQAGEEAYRRGERQLAVDLLRSARRLGAADPTLGWLLADALLVSSYSAEHRFGVDREQVEEGIALWEESTRGGSPDPSSSWIYITRAELNLQLARLDNDNRDLIWQALAYCERCLVLNIETVNLAVVYARAAMLLQLWANAADVLEAAGRNEPGDVDTWLYNLSTALFNAGDLDRAERVLDAARSVSKTSGSDLLVEDARLRLLQGRGQAAREALDQVPGEASEYMLWYRAKYHWAAGERDAFERTIEALLDRSPMDPYERRFLAWATLWHGDAARAATIFEEFCDEDSWWQDVAAELAICQLAAGQVTAGEGRLRDYLSTTRSFEDLQDVVDIDLPVIRWRYGTGPDASPVADALDRLEQLARRRREELSWPATATAEMAGVLTGDGASPVDGGWSVVAARAGLARLAIKRRDWPVAVEQYRLLAGLVERFPATEEGLAWVAREMAAQAPGPGERETIMAAVHEVDAALADLADRSPVRPGRAWTQALLGDVARNLGEFTQARARYEQALATVAALPGAASSDAAEIHGRLGDVLESLQELPAAQDEFQQALALIEADDGPEHLDAARIRSRLGGVLYSLGDLPAAQAEHERALRITEAALGPDHEEIAVDLYRLARVLRDRGELAAAREKLERAVRIDEAAYGPEHPELVTDLEALGGVLREQGELPAARDRYEQALQIAEAAHGPEHPDVATLSARLGDVLHDLGDLPGARAWYQRALDIAEAALGPDDAEIAIGLYKLAGVLRATGDFGPARQHLERALRIDEAAYGPEHQELVTDLEALGDVLHDQGDLPAARPTYERALRIAEAVSGPEHRDVAALCDRLGDVLRELGDPAGAQSRYERALDIAEAELGPDHPEIAAGLFKLAGTHYVQRDIGAARQCLERALRIDEAAYGPEHQELVTDLEALGEVLHDEGDLPAAKRAFERALRIADASLGPDHDRTASVRASRDEVLRLLGEHRR